ncbi:MAG: VIT domain-containing protein [Thermoplasmatota archaeon]
MRWLALLLLISSLHAATASASEYVPIHPGVVQDFVRGADFETLEADIRIDGSIATTRLTLTIANPNSYATSYHAVLPALPGTAILAVNVTTGDEFLEGRMERTEDARADYEASEATGQTAVLLEQQNEAISIRSSLKGNETQVLRVAFVQTVEVRGGHWHHWLPISRSNADETMVTVHAPDTALFPGQTVSYQGDAAVITGANLPDLHVAWPVSGEGWQASALQGNESFLLSLRLTGGEAWPRELALVLDKSGSMSGSKIEDARNSLAGLLPLLPEQDVFAMWTFDGAVTPLTDGFLTVHSQTVTDGQAALQAVPAGGSTNIYAALETALEAMPGDRLSTLVFVTDGLPSAGNTNHATILARVEELAGDTIIHTVAIGVDADQTFLEDIAVQTGGTLTVLRGTQDLEARLAALYSTIHAPVIRDLGLTIPGASSVFPSPLPIYHDDSVLHVVGKGQLPAQWDLAITGESPDGAISETVSVTTSPHNAVDALWAAKQVNAWLTEERLENVDLEDQIVALATTYGIITPYTSWVVSAIDLPSQGDAAEGTAGGTASSASSSSATSSSSQTFHYSSSSSTSYSYSASQSSTSGVASDQGPAWRDAVVKDQAESESTETPFISLFLLLAAQAFYGHRSRR